MITSSLLTDGYTTRELVFNWIDGLDEEGLPKAVQFSNSMELPEFERPRQDMGDCTMYYLTGELTCVLVITDVPVYMSK